MIKPGIETSINIEVNIKEVINTCIKNVRSANKGMSVSKIGL